MIREMVEAFVDAKMKRADMSRQVESLFQIHSSLLELVQIVEVDAQIVVLQCEAGIEF